MKTKLLRRPLVGVAIIFMGGVWLGCYSSGNAAAVCIISLFFLLAAFCLKRHRVSFVLLLLGIFGSGLFTAMKANPAQYTSYLGNILEEESIYIEVEGRVASDPEIKKSHPASKRLLVKFDLQLTGLCRMGAWQRTRGRLPVLIRNASSMQRFEFGQQVRLAGMIHSRSDPKSPDHHVMYVDVGKTQSLYGPSFSVRALIYRARRVCANILSLGLEENAPTAALLKTLLLGYRAELPSHLRRLFSNTGTFHIFAISGLHVGMVSLIIIGTLKLFGVSRQHWVLFLIPLLAVYTIATGARPSALRAASMASIYWSAAFVHRKPDILSSLAAAALLILAIAPMQLQSPGFIMSFLVVTGIVVLYPKLSAPWFVWLQSDPLRLQPEPWLLKKLKKLLRMLGSLFFISLSAWLVSVPVTAYFFNLFAPISLLGNVLVVPGAFLVVFTGILSLASGLVFPWLAEIFNAANQVFVTLLLEVVSFMSDVPGGHAFIKSPNLWLIVGWYIALLLFIFGNRASRKTVVLIFITVCVGVWAWHIKNQQMTIDVFDVGQGNAAFVNLPGTKNDMLIDTGPPKSAYSIIRHLRKSGVDQIGVMLLSHPDVNHIGAASEIIDVIPIRELWIPLLSTFSDRTQRHKGFRMLKKVLNKAKEKNMPIRFLRGGDRGYLGGPQWDVFWPLHNTKNASANHASIVFRIAVEECGVLFMGGATKMVEYKLLLQQENMVAPILIAGNHGAKNVCSEPWLNRTAAKVAIISVGHYNNYNHPDQTTVERLKTHNINVWRTDEKGSLRIEKEEGKPFKAYSINHYKN